MTSYYDLNAILTDAQKVPCVFRLDVPSLGYLSGASGSDLKNGSKVDLPLWLGEMLVIQAIDPMDPENNYITLDMPHALSKRVTNALKADPKSVELRAQATHFYGLGARMLELFDDDEVTEVLVDTFKKRAVEIADKASNSRNVIGEGSEWVRGLDETERALFRASHEGGVAVRKWFEATSKT